MNELGWVENIGVRREGTESRNPAIWKANHDVELEFVCDKCERSFDTNLGRAVHLRSAHN